MAQRRHPAWGRHTHLQLNIKQTMPEASIRADVARAFDSHPDTIVFNEAVKVTHDAIRAHAREYGYGVVIPKGAASQVVLVWRRDRYRAVSERVTQAMSGRAGVSPHRYVVRVRLIERDTGLRLCLIGTHMVSSGWTGSRLLDAWRQRGWYAHYAVMARIIHRAYRHNDVVLWSGDCNRPPATFRGSRPFRRFHVRSAATSKVVETNGTHGRTIFDYVGVLSRRLHVQGVRSQTPAFRSDHDGIFVVFEHR